MLKLLFVENRYATWIYEAVAKQLVLKGHEIHWLVQNPLFAPKWGTVHTIPFPSKASIEKVDLSAYDWLRRTDRGVLHFGGSGYHYPHYDRCISQILDAVQPDFIFGEATEFHELLTIARAREKGMQFLAPTATRYPTDRLAFMAYDTLEPMGGDGSQLPDAEADAMVERIRTRQLVPSYMRTNSGLQLAVAWSRFVDKIRITAGWLAGERFITPSPWRKLQLNAQLKRQRALWDEKAALAPQAFTHLRNSGKPWVLYALQMQPEGNIDVWGSPWNDQADTIQRAARALALTGASLVVKPNPKSKYEMNAQLNRVMDNEPNLIRLDHSVPMGQVLPHAHLVLSVTGTVILESVFSGYPIACLGRHAMSQYAGVTALNEPEDVAKVLHKAIHKELLTATASESRALIQYLHRTSFSAGLWDPLLRPNDFTKTKINPLVEAFASIIQQLSNLNQRQAI